MTEPARESADVVPVDNSQLSDTDKIEIMRQQLEWLCINVSGLLNAAASNPMMRMMLKKGMGQ